MENSLNPVNGLAGEVPAVETKVSPNYPKVPAVETRLMISLFTKAFI